MPSAGDLDLVTLDAFGTLVELDDPVPRLQAELAARGVEKDPPTVAAAFGAEVEYYLAHKGEGRDPASLEALRRACAQVFLESAHAPLDADAFAPAFLRSLVFRPLPGVTAALERLRAAGLTLVCVSDWDSGVGAQLAAAGVGRHLDAVVSSAEVGAEKPDPAVFAAALRRVGLRAERVLHCGDGQGDREGAERAGLYFEPVPVATLPGRLGL